MTFQEYLREWSRLHGSASPTGLVRVWLRIAFSCATPIIRLNPNFITASALLPMAAAIYLVQQPNPKYAVASFLVLLVGFIDNFDGIVAVRTKRVTNWGAFLDAVVDRIIDICIGVLFFAIGSPLELVIFAVSLALIHEYMRAKASGIGLREVGVITPAEKPTRIAIGVMFLLACGIMPAQAVELATVASLTWLTIGVISFGILMRSYKKLLTRD